MGLVLVSVDGRPLGELELHGREGFHRVVAQKGHVYLPAVDVLLHEGWRPELIVDGRYALPELPIVMNDPEAEGDGLVLGFDDEGVFQLFGELRVRLVKNGEARCGEAFLDQDHLGYHLVQGDGVRFRAGTHVGDAKHLEHGGHVGVAGPPLDPVAQVEDQSRALPRDDGGHELFQVFNQVLVTLENLDLVASRPQGVPHLFDGLQAVPLPVRHAEEVDHRLAVAVVDNGDLHGFPPEGMLFGPIAFPSRRGSATP